MSKPNGTKSDPRAKMRKLDEPGKNDVRVPFWDRAIPLHQFVTGVSFDENHKYPIPKVSFNQDAAGRGFPPVYHGVTVESLPKPKHVEEKFEPTTNKHDCYSEIPTDIATPPAAVFPTADDTNDPPTASSLPDILSLSRRVDSLSAKIDTLASTIEGSVLSFFTLVKELDKKFERRFDEVDRRFDEVDRRFNGVDRRFNEVDRRFDEVDRRFGRVDKALDNLFERVSSVEEKFSSLERRFDLFETGVGKRFDSSDLASVETFETCGE
ncbi:hypothetical protein Q9L58_010505 [Maublancomyces gigas]|uniref:Uncharacterized protein n=1 Tax=Discina gigas TaxID=1032678 RepID=A0ABR3G3W6_9PEZI